jgi:hypothetical protein
LCAEREPFTGGDGGIHLVEAITRWYYGTERSLVLECVEEVVRLMWDVESLKWSSNLDTDLCAPPPVHRPAHRLVPG